MNTAKKNLWLVNHKLDLKSKLILICFHHAGGAASFFYKWKNYLPKEIDLMAIQLPGRELRIAEAPLYSMKKIVTEITDSLKIIEKPFIFFGHSLGALLASEVVYQLTTAQLKLLQYLIISGYPAPHYPIINKQIHQLPDHEFINAVHKIYDGIDHEILQNHELINLLLPRLRADITLSEKYNYVFRNQKFDIPILALGGKNDPTVDETSLLEWNQYTQKQFTTHLFPGGHFYLCHQTQLVINVINNIVFKNLIDSSL